METSRIRQKTVVEQVMEAIKDLIASNKYMVNDKIPTENELAERFGTGRTSIREAIKIFQYLGILESRTGRGTFVCDRTNINKEALTWTILLGQNNLREIIELREVLEERGIRNILRTQKEKPENFKRFLHSLSQRLEKLKDAVTSRQIEEIIKADYDFHDTIIRESRNGLFNAMYNTLKAFMYEEIKQVVQIMESTDVIQYHQTMFEAMRSGNEKEAIKSLFLHLDVIREKMGVETL